MTSGVVAGPAVRYFELVSKGMVDAYVSVTPLDVTTIAAILEEHHGRLTIDAGPAGTTYVASFHSNGHYSATPNYFSTPKTNGPLTAPSGNNGVYAYGSGNVFPNSSFENTNYWVDVMFHPAAPTPNEAPVAQNDSGFSTVQNTALQISASALLANDTDPNGDPLTITGVSAFGRMCRKMMDR